MNATAVATRPRKTRTKEPVLAVHPADAVPPPDCAELDRKVVLAALDRLRMVAPKRTWKPILGGVRLEADGERLRLAAVDLEMTLTMTAPATGVLPACVVECHELIRRLKAASCPQVSLSLVEDGKVLAVNGGAVRHRLVTMELNDFPVLPAEPTSRRSLSLESTEFRNALSVTSTAAAQEQIRYAINGILLDSDKTGVRLVATDGRRMATVELPAAKGRFRGRVILPSRAAGLVQKLVGLKEPEPLRLIVQPVVVEPDRGGVGADRSGVAIGENGSHDAASDDSAASANGRSAAVQSSAGDGDAKAPSGAKGDGHAVDSASPNSDDAGDSDAGDPASNGNGHATHASGIGTIKSARKCKKKKETPPDMLIIQAAGWQLTAMLCEGHFPKYSDVIPEPGSRFVLDCRLLIAVVKQVALGTGDPHRTLRLELADGLLKVWSESPEVGRAEALVECQFDGGGDREIHTGFNPAFLLDALQTLDGEHVVIDVQQNILSPSGEQVCGRPALFYRRENPTGRWLIMPITLGLPPSRASLGSNYIEPEAAHAS